MPTPESLVCSFLFPRRRVLFSVSLIMVEPELSKMCAYKNSRDPNLFIRRVAGKRGVWMDLFDFKANSISLTLLSVERGKEERNL